MTCKHLKSSRYIEKLLSVTMRDGTIRWFNASAAMQIFLSGNAYKFNNEECIRTICADCGKVLKEVKVIEK